MDIYNDLTLDNELMVHLSFCKGSHAIYAAPNQRINFEERKDVYVYLIQSGSVNVRRKHDDIIILTVKGPSILGLTSIFSGVYYHYLSTATECSILAIPRDVAIGYIDERGLWRDTAKVLCQAAQFYYKRDEVISGNTVYDVIKKHLEILWQYSSDERQSISVFDFIMTRSNVSRSSLNKVLKDLSLGGYIIMNRGRLLDMKKLPQHY